MIRPLSRRHVLRGMLGGTGVALALPTLEAMLPRAHAVESSLGPIFGVFYWANGLPWHARHGVDQANTGYPDLWTPTQTGAGYTASELLTPIAHHQPTVITGLEPHTAIPAVPDGQSDGHMRGFMVALTGDRIRPEGFNHPSHTLTALRPSLDQLVARDPAFYGSSPPQFRSIEVGVSTARFHDYGHWNAISYNGPDSTNPPILEAQRLHDLLFGLQSADNRHLRRRADLLDAVLDDAQSLRARLGQADKLRLEAHLDHLNEVQRRLDLGAVSCLAPGAPSASGDLLVKTETMAELLAIGLACNLTRSFSFMLTSPASTHLFSGQGASTDMHTTCHAGQWEVVRRITAYQMQAFARFLDALDAEIDPTGASVLDRAVIYGTSEYGEGWLHSVAELPVVLVGGGNGRLHRGVHVREQGGNLCRAQLTALQALDLPYGQFGFNGAETSSPFSELLV
jgi:hypothetical protein